MDGTAGYALANRYVWEDAPSGSEDPGRFTLRIEDADGHSLTVWSGSELLQLGSGELFRCTESRDEAYGQEPFSFLLYRAAHPAYYAEAGSVLTVPGSVTDYDVVAREMAEAWLRRTLDRPAWIGGSVEDGYVEASPVFDAYYGDDQPNFCFGMGLRLKIAEPNTVEWQAGAGLGEPDAQGYYSWGAEITVMKLEDGDWHWYGGATGGSSVYIPGYGNDFGYMQESADVLIDLYFKTSGGTRDWRILSALAGRPSAELRSALAKLPEAQRTALLAGMARYNEDYPQEAGSSWPPQFDLKALG